MARAGCLGQGIELERLSRLELLLEALARLRASCIANTRNRHLWARVKCLA